MIAQSVITGRGIVITETDFDRLQALVDSPRYRASHPAPLMVLKEELNRGKVVPVGSVPRGVVTMHSEVQVRDVKSDQTERYTLVYPDEADIDEGRLSVLAPLGVALLGTKAGQTIRFDAPAGARRVKLEKVVYQPEAAGDFHL